MFRSFAFATALALTGASATAQPAGPLAVFVKVYPSAGREGDLQALYVKRLEYLRHAEPEVSFKLHRSAKEPTVFLWYEIYPSQAAYEKHLKVVMPNYRKEFGPTPEGILAKPSESEVYAVVED